MALGVGFPSCSTCFVVGSGFVQPTTCAITGPPSSDEHANQVNELSNDEEEASEGRCLWRILIIIFGTTVYNVNHEE